MKITMWIMGIVIILGVAFVAFRFVQENKKPAPPKKVKLQQKKKSDINMEDFEVIGIYASATSTIVVIRYNNKTYIIERGAKFHDYVLTGGDKYNVFLTKDGTEYKKRINRGTE